MTPTFDNDGYPTELTLSIIEDWKIESQEDLTKLFDYAKEAYHSLYGNWYVIDDYDKLSHWYFEPFDALIVTTGGWSGNESVIRALMENPIIRMRCLIATFAGGMYIFDINPFKGA